MGRIIKTENASLKTKKCKGISRVIQSEIANGQRDVNKKHSIIKK